MDDFDEIKKVTVSPRGQAGGVTQFLPSSERLDSGLYTREYLENQLVVALGGRAAEEIVFGKKNVTTGASGDLKRVHEIARMMVTSYGFGQLGNVLWMDSMVSPEMSANIDKNIMEMANKAYSNALDIVQKNKPALDAIANALLERETINGDDVMSIVKNIKI